MTISATRIRLSVPLSVRRSVAALAMLAGACATNAQTQRAVPDALYEEEAAWAELATTLPPAPKPAKLIAFAVGPASALSFAVDAESLSVGSDGVVHYTLVATSASGARNVSYEGIRCESFEVKYYAFGRSDGSWGRSRRDQWTAIPTGDQRNPQATLARDYFCDSRAVNGKVPYLLRKLRHQTPIFE